MKVAIVLLVVLGLIAGISAAAVVMFARSRTGPDDASQAEVTVYRAVKALPALTVVQAEHLIEETATTKDLPVGYLTSIERGLGKILAVPVVEGQIFTSSCFIAQGTPAQLAATLPEGMRVFTVTVSKKSVSGGLLYPGCIVDVLATFRLARSDKGEALSTTLLREIRVLAVNNATIVSEQAVADEAEEAAPKATQNGGDVILALMVEPKQAEALQLATEHGIISVTMRNPLDQRAVATNPTLLSQGQLAILGSAMDPTTLLVDYSEGKIPNPADGNNLTAKSEATAGKGVGDSLIGRFIGDSVQRLVKNLANTAVEPTIPVKEEQTANVVQPVPVATAKRTEPIQKTPVERSSWSVTVIRGQTVETEEVELQREKE